MSCEDKDLEVCFQVAMDKYADMVYRVAMNQMKNKEDADDIFQEVFLKWMKYRDRFENEEHEKSWLIRVTINQCKNVLTSSWRKRNEALSEEIQNTMAYEDTYAEESELLKVIEKLPEKYRIVIHLFYYEELSVAEICKVTGDKDSTVKTQLTRGRRKLKHLLKVVVF